jgi:4-aminobutyrate aminotransferase-like enzyme/Ser/Thr protein kinase RdoA (MazF antagonist)
MTPDTVIEVLKERFGLGGVEVTPLGGELDQNAAVLLDDGSRVVVKVSRQDVAHLRWQHELIRLASGALGSVQVPTVRTTLDGGSIVVTSDGPAVTVQSWLAGRTLSELNSHSPELLEELGATAARLVRALAGAPAPPGGRTHHWDLLRAPEAVAEGITAVGDPARLDDVHRVIARFSRALEVHRSALPTAVVHQDLNDFNVLARRGPDGRHHVHAVLDFADALHTARVSELAVAVAYAMLRAANPLTAAAAVVRGYASVGDLTDAELSVLFPLAAARLCVNAVTWTHRGGDYGQARMRHTWPAVAACAATPPELAEALLRDAAGRPVARTAVTATGARCVVPGLIPFPLDESLDSPGGIRLGRHLEPDHRTPLRRMTTGGETATLGLGVAIESPNPFTVHAPFEAVVESVGEPVIVLRHDREDAETLWSRWTGVTALHGDGVRIPAGGLVGWVEGQPGEGHPRVRVAVFRSRETALMATPVLVPPSEAAGWARVSPDPAELLGLPEARRPDDGWDATRVVASRNVHFARSQRSYYRRPMNLVGGRGSWLYDDVGHAYLDAINNVSHVGHANRRVVAAATAQMRALNTNSRFVYPGIARYTERLTATLPAALEVVFLVCSGSEANDLAVRMARQVTGRRDILVVDGAYHGNTSVLTGLSPNRYKGPGGTGPDPTTHEVEQPNRYRGRHGYGDPDAGHAYAEDVRRQVDGLTAVDTPPAAFIAESVMGTAGSVFYPDGYLAEAYAAVRAAGGLCIADEVQVGFGRLGDVFWGFESQGVVPDIVTMGKPMGNGHPMAAVVTTRDIADAFDSGMRYFNTFGGNPVSCAIGTAVLDEIEVEGLREHAAATGRHFRYALDTLAVRHELVGDVRGHGMYLGVELVSDRHTKEPATAEALHVSELMKDEGVLVYPTGAANNTLKIKPPLTFTAADADLFTSVLDDVLGRDW